MRELSRRSAWAMSCLAMLFSGCGAPAPSAPPTASASAAAVSAAPAAGPPSKVVVVRLGGGFAVEEPPDKDLIDGLKQGGLQNGKDYELVTLDAGGDLAKVAPLLEQAVADGADLIFALHRETARLAAKHVDQVPVVFGVTAVSPYPLGVGTNASEHKANITGAFISLKTCFFAPLARGCFRDATSVGIVVDPDDPACVGAKELLQTADAEHVRPPLKFEIAEARKPSECAPAVADLAKRGIAVLFLVPGRGLDTMALLQAANEANVPVFGYTAEHARAGAAVSRVPGLRWIGFEAGRRAARVLQKEGPASLAILEGPDCHTLVNQAALERYKIKLPGYFGQSPRVKQQPITP